MLPIKSLSVFNSNATPWDEVIYLAGKFMGKHLFAAVRVLRSMRRNEFVSELEEKLDSLSLSVHHRIAEIGRCRMVRETVRPRAKDINVG
jgi:hypothetical protein